MTFYGLLGCRHASFQHLPQLGRNLGELGELSVVTWIIGLHARHVDHHCAKRGEFRIVGVRSETLFAARDKINLRAVHLLRGVKHNQ